MSFFRINFSGGTEEQDYRGFFPYITASILLICVAIFAGINIENNPQWWLNSNHWGYFTSDDIRDGKLWGLLTNAFVHKELWHIGFNMYWLWIFGRKIEFEKGHTRFLLIVLSSAIVSSIWEMAFGDGSGIGFSGVGFALFGYIYMQDRRNNPAFAGFMNVFTVNLFMFWMFFCLVLTLMHLWQVGNAAHASGLIWGMLLAYCENMRFVVLRFFIPLLIFFLSIVPVYWAPWSVSWLFYKAHGYHEKQQLKEALQYYSKILHIEPDNEYAHLNMRNIEAHQLSLRAYDAMMHGDFKTSDALCDSIFLIDSTNAWAKEVRASREVQKNQLNSSAGIK
jgi:GlpG protein